MTRRIRKPTPTEQTDERDPPLVDPLDPKDTDCPEVPDEDDETFKGSSDETPTR